MVKPPDQILPAAGLNTCYSIFIGFAWSITGLTHTGGPRHDRAPALMIVTPELYHLSQVISLSFPITVLYGQDVTDRKVFLSSCDHLRGLCKLCSQLMQLLMQCFRAHYEELIQTAQWVCGVNDK